MVDVLTQLGGARPDVLFFFNSNCTVARKVVPVMAYYNTPKVSEWRDHVLLLFSTFFKRSFVILTARAVMGARDAHDVLA
jgi:hypothetical protein